jgi:hypothetical protein
LLQCYISERQTHLGIVQLITALVTVLATYIIATVGVVAHVCHFHEVFEGCTAVPTAIAWVAPAPGIGVLAFLTAMRVWLAASWEYAYILELELAQRTLVPDKPRLPQLLTRYKRNGSFTKNLPMTAYSLTYLLAMAYVLGEALFVIQWHRGGKTVASGILVGIYLVIITVFSVSRWWALRKEIEPMSEKLYELVEK